MMRHKTMMRLGAVVVLLVMALLMGNVTYARYRQAVEKDLSFTAKTLAEGGAFSLVSTKGWQSAENGMTLTFTLSFEGATAEKQAAVLRLTATQALSDTVQVTLTAGDVAYTATKTAVAEGSALYAQMGAGYEFRFLDENGEIPWEANQSQPLSLSVSGTSDAALLRLFVSEA